MQPTTAHTRRSGSKIFRRTHLLAIALSVLSILPQLAAPPTPLRAQSAATPLALVWSSLEVHPTTSTAWGDVDNDGDLDLAVGNYEKPDQLYLNERGQLRSVWDSDPESDQGGYERTTSVAWGDYDNDGDLDLLVGNSAPFYTQVSSPDQIQGQRNRVYRNCTFTRPGDGCQPADRYLTHRSAWSTAEKDSTLSVAWGDYDGDGDLDFAAGNGAFTQVRVTLGSRTISFPLPVGQPDRIYRNNWPEPGFTPFFLTPTPIADATTSVAWGDYDGDGKLDLAAGNIGLPVDQVCDRFPFLLRPEDCGDVSRVYHNETVPGADTTPAFSVGWETAEHQVTFSAAWADADNDGRLDLAFGNVSIGNGAFAIEGHNRLYLNAGCAPQCPAPAQPFTQSPWLADAGDPTGETTIGLAWGDVDSDGDLDLATANAGAAGSAVVGQPVRVYRNCKLTQPGDGCLPGDANLSTRPIWESQERDDTFSVAWGDADNDGDLDLVAGNMGVLFSQELPGQPNRLYRNDLGLLRQQATPQAPETTTSALSVAWGDYTGDGYADLAVGERLPNQVRLFRNVGGDVVADQLLSQPEAVASVAWGDADADGDLDLATGGTSGGVRLYLNQSGLLALAEEWRVPFDPAVVFSVAWGDVDNDADLDLAVGVAGSEDGEGAGLPNVLYRNCLRRQSGDTCAGPDLLARQPAWQSAERDHTASLAWGDMDNDGDLDLAAGNLRGVNRLYRNERGLLRLDASWAPARDGTVSLAWGDYDGDGYLDLAVGNLARPNQIYHNRQGSLPSVPDWSSIEAEITTSVAWGDMDNDGDLDLAAGNAGFFDGGVDTPQGDSIYRNEGDRLDTRASWKSVDPDFTAAVAWGDVDNDGDLDLVAANTNTPLQLYRNDRSIYRASAAASNPTTAVGQPIAAPPLPPANFYATPQILPGPTVTFSYTLSHPNALPVQQVIGEYSLNGGGAWAPALPAPGTRTTNLPTSPAGTAYTYTWDVFGNGVMGQSDNVVFRLRVIPDYRPQPNLPGAAAGLFLHGSYAATTAPFRLRGTQVQVFNGAAPAADAIVYRRRDPLSEATPFPTPPANHEPLRTDARGFLQGRSILDVGDEIAALVPISSTDTYTLYYTSAPATTTGVQFQPVERPGLQTLTAAPDNPLMLLNLKVALEWDGRNDSIYNSQLKSDLRRASEVLFDLTNGQVALGTLALYHGREQWDDANIRVYASNRLRPSAVKGGVVSTVITDPLSLELTTPLSPALTYEPGQVRIGSVWNRFASSGASGDDWARTLAHELSHYALFLDDNYIGLDDGGLLIGVDTCRGAMVDPYADSDSELHPASGWLPGCAQTLSNQATRVRQGGAVVREGRSDWETIRTFYPWLKQPDGPFDTLNPGPSNLPLAVTLFRDVYPPEQGRPAPLANFFVSLKRPNGDRYLASAGARAILFQGDRLLDLGRPVLDQVEVRGARPGERLCVYDFATNHQGCRPIGIDNTSLILAPVSGWAPDIVITPVTSRTLTLQVLNLTEGLTVTARLYPANSSASTSSAQRLAYGAAAYSGTFTLDQPSFEGYVHVWAEQGAERYEAIADYLIGGNPGRKWAGFAPRGSPGRKWAGFAPVLSADGQVIVYDQEVRFDEGTFAAIQSATLLPEAPPWATVVGAGYRLTASPGAPELTRASIDIGYFDRDLLPGTEGGLAIFFYDEARHRWEKLPTRLDPDRNEASTKLRGQGIYALMSDLNIGLGWNNVAFPWPKAASVAATLDLLNGRGRYTTVYGYSPDDPGNQWKVYDVDVPAWVDDLAALEYGRGYWINATEGSLRTSAQTRQAALADNLPAPPATFYAALSDAGAAPGETVQARIGGAACGEATTRQVGGQVVFAIDVFAADGGAYAECGVPGREVTFTMNGRSLPFIARWGNTRPLELKAVGADSPRSIYVPLAMRGFA